ncbi:kinesin-domain-containing protein [Phialemonium atrogriseum]|uniref:Kinesin-domain-containing protein n=1 Tax=Phialemonium atrogriseum TaxID=1093897 RepID=A0AAJ0BZY7_9PEZI|nr:kinesin-domain-containing protein [Phialemonium atrogriseum]KAK1767356.1 kinesin-domain-containing protein [Phialemonium atrogriseum]
MSVRVVARIRPLLEKEWDKDTIVTVQSSEEGKKPNIVKIPNPKNETEEFSFAFNGVYDQPTSQEELFTAEVAPHLKALFQGLDVTIFAYGVTGTGKTHTMRGGLKLAERGVIPRLLSGVFRRGKKIAKDTGGETAVEVALSYYEIYNDKVFDLLEPPDKRTPSGLPLREKDGKTIVVGLSERSCQDLKDFERLYIEANTNRVTASTKLNAHSSRSHAILRVKVTQTTGDTVRESTASAIDLAGSEDNRRTDNGKERLVESAAINKSLFVLSQCIDAISRGDKRIPYRESKMTRILSLGQNNGITIMILNLAPMRSYHLDTLSSLNVSSRAKRIEVREIENEVVFKQAPRAASSSIGGASIQRQPLRPLANAHNVHTGAAALAASRAASTSDKPIKAFSVYTDRTKPQPQAAPRRSNAAKRPLDPAADSQAGGGRASKLARPTHQPLVRVQPQQQQQPSISAAQIEAMVERKVAEILASRTATAAAAAPAPAQISDEVQRRLEALERRINEEEERGRSQQQQYRSGDGRSDGLRLLLQARQAKERGDEAGALALYEAALPFFPGQAKLVGKIERLRARVGGGGPAAVGKKTAAATSSSRDVDDEDEYRDDGGEADVDDDDDDVPRARVKAGRKTRKTPATVCFGELGAPPPTPRTKKLLDIVNSRDLALIRGLRGFGAKKAHDLVELLALKGEGGDGCDCIETLAQLRLVPGMGGRTVDRAYEGLVDAQGV